MEKTVREKKRTGYRRFGGASLRHPRKGNEATLIPDVSTDKPIIGPSVPADLDAAPLFTKTETLFNVDIGSSFTNPAPLTDLQVDPKPATSGDAYRGDSDFQQAQIPEYSDESIAIEQQYRDVAEEYLQSVGLPSAQSTDRQPHDIASSQSALRLKKETVTHNGSCGANSIVIGFCIALLEGNISYDAEKDYSKLLLSWNATYPQNKAENASELFEKIKQHLEGCDSTEMENLLSPVVRTYYGIAMLMQRKNQRDEPRLTDDSNYTWTPDLLTESDCIAIRDSIAEAAFDTISGLAQGEILLDEIENPLSFGYYLDENELEIVANELLKINFMRATQLDINATAYQEIDDKIKANQSFIERARNFGINIESNSMLEADPHDIAMSLNDDARQNFSYYRISTDEPSYQAWVKFTGAVRERWVMSHMDHVDEFIHKAKTAAVSKGVPFEVAACKSACEAIVISAIEQEFLLQLQDGNIIADMSNRSANAIHVVHSRSAYWDALLPQSLYDKYTRTRLNNIPRSHREAFASKHMAYSATLDQFMRLAESFFSPADSISPYLNLASDACLSRLHFPDIYTYDDEDSTEYYDILSHFYHSFIHTISTAHLALLVISILLAGVIAGLFVTAGFLLCQTVYQMSQDNETTITDEHASDSKASSDDFSPKATPRTPQAMPYRDKTFTAHENDFDGTEILGY